MFLGCLHFFVPFLLVKEGRWFFRTFGFVNGSLVALIGGHREAVEEAFEVDCLGWV